MSTRGPSGTGGLTAFDGVKLVGIVVAVLVAVALVSKVVGAIMSLVWTVLACVAVVAAAWVLWSLVRGGGDR